MGQNGRKMMVTLAESGHPVFRSTSPLSRGVLKSKGGGKLSIDYCANQDTITTIFRTITSVNQLSLYGAVAEMCEEYESFHDRTEKPVVGGQSSSPFVPSVIKTHVPLDSDDRALTTCCLQGKYGVEIRIMSISKDNSHSWVRISHGLNKLVTNLNNNEQETSEVQFGEYALRLNASDFASRSKAKAKPQRRDSASSSTRTVPIGERTWTYVEPGEYSISHYEVSKKLIHLLRHGSLPRENDGAIEFWRIKDNLQKHFLYCHHWSDDKWKKSMAGGGNKKRYQCCTDSSGAILYLRALQGHSGRSLIDPALQDNVVIPRQHLPVHLSFRMCNQFTFHHQFGIDTGRSKFEQQTDSILSALWIPCTKTIRILTRST